MEEQLEEHEMQYRGAVAGADPGWYCTCNHFVWSAKAIPGWSGNNLNEAQRAFEIHRTAEIAYHTAK